MPVTIGKDSTGCYAVWGSQKKYYYECGNEEAKKAAEKKANAQGQVVRSTGYMERIEELARKLKI